MMRLLLVLFFAFLVGSAAPSSAQTAASPPSAAAPTISTDQARAALDVLNDPGKRAAFSATLNAIIKAHPGTAPGANSGTAPGTAPGAAAGTAATPEPGGKAPAPTAEPPASETTVQGLHIPLAPDSLGAQVLLSASAFVNNVGDQAVEALNTVQSLPLLYGWAMVMATNPTAQGILADVSWRVILALVCAAAAEYGLRRAMRRPIRGLEGLAPSNRPALPTGLPPDLPLIEPVPVLGDGTARAEAGELEAPQPHPRPSAWTLLKRVPVVLARLVLELVPVFGIVLVGHLIAGSSLGGQTVSRLVILAVVDSYAICAALLCVARMLLSPGESRLRLFHVRDSAAVYLMSWSRRLILIAVFGYAIGEVGLLLGLSDIAHGAFEKAVGLVLHLCLAFMVIQNRRAVRRVLRAPEGSTGIFATVRDRFAGIWHVFALFFLIAGWLIWAIEVPHGYAAVAHYFVVTGLVLLGARLALLLLLGSVDRLMRPDAHGGTLQTGTQARLATYHSVVTTALRLTIYLLCVLGLLQLYGLNTFLWFIESALGLRVLSASGTLLVTLVLAFGVWEVVNGGVQQHLDRLQREAQLAKSARLRTLLPLLRTTLLITIAIVASPDDP